MLRSVQSNRPRSRGKGGPASFRPQLVRLEDRMLPASYTWAGPAGGRWSTQANWNPPGTPGVADTVLFNNTDNNNSLMDLPNTNGNQVSVLQIQGYSGTITLSNIIFQSVLYVDVLTMSSGKIAGSSYMATLYVEQVAGSVTFANSTWSGGEIAVPLQFLGDTNHTITVNLGDPAGRATPSFTDNAFYAGPFSLVNWKSGNVTMAPNSTLSNFGIFNATSTGAISSTGAKWTFDNFGSGVGSKATLNNNTFKIEKNSRWNGQAGTSPGGGGTFEIDGDVIQEGTLEIDSGSFYVTGSFTQHQENSSDPSPLTKSYGTSFVVDGDTTLRDGTIDIFAGTFNVRVGNFYEGLGVSGFSPSLNLHGNVANLLGQVIANGAGLIQLQGGRLVASGGVSLSYINNSSGAIYGPGDIAGNVSNAGFIAAGADPGPDFLTIDGDYSQAFIANRSLLSMRILGDGSQYDQLQVNGNITLGSGTLTSSGLYVDFNSSQLQANTFPNFITYYSLTGTFNISTLQGYSFYATYGPTSITLTTFPPGPYPTPRRANVVSSSPIAPASTAIADSQHRNSDTLDHSEPMAQLYPFSLSDESLRYWTGQENRLTLDSVFDTEPGAWIRSLVSV